MRILAEILTGNNINSYLLGEVFAEFFEPTFVYDFYDTGTLSSPAVLQGNITYVASPLATTCAQVAN